MNKKKTIIVISAVFIALAAAVCVFLASGGMVVEKDIECYESPDGKYFLYFSQLGDPAFPFGQTDVRLKLTDSDGRVINTADTFILDDGANASAGNISSVLWAEDSVSVILCASEMEEREIVIEYPE